MNALKSFTSSLAFRLFALLMAGFGLALAASMIFAFKTIDSDHRQLLATQLSIFIASLQTAEPAQRDGIAQDFAIQRLPGQATTLYAGPTGIGPTVSGPTVLGPTVLGPTVSAPSVSGAVTLIPVQPNVAVDKPADLGSKTDVGGQTHGVAPSPTAAPRPGSQPVPGGLVGETKTTWAIVPGIMQTIVAKPLPCVMPESEAFSAAPAQAADAGGEKQPAAPVRAAPVCDTISIAMADGSIERFAVPKSEALNGAIPWLSVVFFVLLLGGLAAGAAFFAALPVHRLAGAAKHLGQNMQAEPLQENGPSEVVEAARAFNAMQRRIQDHIVEKTQILAAITHDLRTPLTRMRLRLERLSDDELKERMRSDIIAMDRLISEGLVLASLQSQPERITAVRLATLVQASVEDAVEAGQQVRLTGVAEGIIACDRELITRAINNVVDNALIYGGNADLHISETADWMTLTVSDGGPGMSEEGLERAFDPFWREDSSRSRETGGSGLGLAIARRILDRHGGTIRVANKTDGAGLICTICLPRLATAI